MRITKRFDDDDEVWCHKCGWIKIKSLKAENVIKGIRFDCSMCSNPLMYGEIKNDTIQS